MRQRNLSANNKRQRGKKPPSEQIKISAELQPTGDEESELEDSVINGVEMEYFGNCETNCKDDVDTVTDVEHIDGHNLGTLSVSAIETNGSVEHINEQIANGLVLPAVTRALAINIDEGQHLSGVQREDLIVMIKNAERRFSSSKYDFWARGIGTHSRGTDTPSNEQEFPVPNDGLEMYNYVDSTHKAIPERLASKIDQGKDKRLELASEARNSTWSLWTSLYGTTVQFYGHFGAILRALRCNSTGHFGAFIRAVVSRRVRSDAEQDRSVFLTKRSDQKYLTNFKFPGIFLKSQDILLLDQARVHALEDISKILGEKETLQGEIITLEKRLAEADARVKVASHKKMQVELLEGQLEKLRNELIARGELELYENQNDFLNEEAHLASDSHVHLLSKEVDTFRTENIALKDDIQALKSMISNVKNTDERMATLESECSLLESSVKDLESKLLVSQQDSTKISTLKVEYHGLWEKVENLQHSLDKATKQADQAILVLEQTQDLRKKVDKLEGSLEEANVHKVSSEKMQQYYEIMQQKIKLLEECLQKSDQDIFSYVQLYQESLEEFQDTLNSLKEETKKRAANGPVDKPWEFWSCLLLTIDGWVLEKKISNSDAKLLRELVWKKDRRICDAYIACKEKNEREVISTFLRLTSSQVSSGLHVVHIAAEMAPVAKLKVFHFTFHGWLRNSASAISNIPAIVYNHQILITFVLLKGCYFSTWDVVTGLGKTLQKKGHLVEVVLPKYDCIQYDGIRDLRAPLYWDLYAPKGLNSARICFTCHNFEYQGAASASELASCGLDAEQLNRPDRMQDNTSHDRVNPIKGAIVFSNIVTTVSPTYAQEVRTAEGGKGLHSTLNFHSRKFVGILNGIDTDAWNPAADNFIKVQYSANDIQGKAENKAAIQRQLGLSSADDQRPLREFEGIASQFQHHEHVRLILTYDESLSHSIFAASDMFIIPSIFEPCGLTQMIAMRYGSVPIARKTGGLNDSALERAFDLYKNNKEIWKQLVQNDMNMDFSWDSSASQYEELYTKSLSRARAAASSD
ncbi:putative starch synthase 4 [Hibiscus syriacus]|uniref:starch synthase n=1 Tax=Hibiscus syriacus TaxID=106335 RepID=A0A6A2Y1Q5_HIBSY|nr:putative starch synthase 4 [Hibiscus syriacus]